MNPHWLRHPRIASLLLLGLFLLAEINGLLQPLARQAYDFGLRASHHPTEERVTLITIDAASIARLGPWPWSKQRHARLLEILGRDRPKAIGFTFPFPPSSPDPGIEVLGKIKNYLSNSTASTHNTPLTSTTQEFATNPAINLDTLNQLLDEGLRALNTEQMLATAINNIGSLFLTMPVTSDPLLPTTKQNPPAFLLASALAPLFTHTTTPQPLIMTNANIPPETLGAQAAGIGAEYLPADTDDIIRTIPLVISLHNQIYPSLALTLAGHYLNLTKNNLQLRQNNTLLFGTKQLHLQPAWQIAPYFHPGDQQQPEFSTHSFHAILDGNIPPKRFRDKIVLIGLTDPQLVKPRLTPLARPMTPLEIHAQLIASLLNLDYYTTPKWASMVHYTLYLLITLLLFFALPRQTGRAFPLLLTLFLTGVVLLFGQNQLMIHFALWLPLTGLLTFLLIGTPLLLLQRNWVANSENNRKLEVTLQNQNRVPLTLEKLHHPATDPLNIHQPTTTSQIGIYPIEQELSIDALGTLFLAHHPQSQQSVIVRHLNPRIPLQDPHRAEQNHQLFFHDAPIWIKLKHPGLLTILDIGTQEDRPFLIMAPFPVDNLMEQYTHPEKLLPFALILYVAIQAAMALDAAHQQGITHGNLRPDDLIFDPESRQVQIKEFGIARFLGADPNGTGITPYAPPETLTGLINDPRSDLYALGAIIFHFFTGHPPFKADNPEELRNRILSAPVPSMHTFRPQTATTLEQIMAKTLQKQPENRYQRGSEMAKELLRFVKTQVKKRKV